MNLLYHIKDVSAESAKGVGMMIAGPDKKKKITVVIIVINLY